jgi:eukaryotic-like serine/threonine-protein kinase
MKCPHCQFDNTEDSSFCRKCGTQLPLSVDLQIGRTLTLDTVQKIMSKGTLFAGRYKILGELGRGGMGIVYQAEDTKLKRLVALKFLPAELSRYPEAKERFIREAQAAAVLDHPHICTVHEVEEAEGATYIAMAYVEGRTLREMISKLPLAADQAVDIALQVAEGLAEAHKKGIVHRDIKSANIMVREDSQARIMDFGLARIEGESVITREAKTMGTVAYMSPEQARGEVTDHRTDIWSLGVVLYEMLTGALPFRGEREQSIMYAIVNEEPRPLDKVRPGLPAELARIVGKALEKDRDARYASAAEMAADLRKYQESAKAAAAGVFNLKSLVRRLRKPQVAVPTVLVLAAVAVLVFWFFNRQSKIHWARNVALPKIKELSEGWNFVETYRLAVEAEKYIPKDPQLAACFKKISTQLSIITEPAGAKAYVREYRYPDGDWEYLGVTPIENLRIPYEFLRFKIEKEDFEPVLGASTTWDIDSKTNKILPGKIVRKLDKTGEIPPGMVRISGGELDVNVKVGDFFIDRYEVTNRQFKEFMDSGGYRTKEYWKNAFVKDRKELSWDEAIAAFVDSTGRPGPATWQGGDYPEGQDDFPVSGVSWYEAAAYAEFAGKALPTGSHFGIARGSMTQLIAGKGFAEFFTPQSNFAGKGPERVGSRPAITAYGVYDMGGNVREWCSNETKAGRVIRGGAWNDIPYMFGNWSQAPPFDRSPKNGFRCVVYVHPEEIPKSLFEPAEVGEAPDFYKTKPVSDAVFQVYKEQYSYDKSDLDARVETRDENSKDWIKEKISFAAAYDNERVPVYLFLPKNASPPYQTVIYFPGSGSAMERSSQNIENVSEFKLLQPLIKNGRAVLYPVYKATFERGSDALFEIHSGADSRQYTELFIEMVKDLKRSIDYLETRADIDSNKLAYLGFSWGGMYGAIIPAVEDRLKTSILNVGGMWSGVRPEVDSINYVGRVKIPTLMLNGRYDMTFVYETDVKPMFDLMGTPREQKKLVLYDTDHIIPRNEYIKETLAWLDKYFGPVKFER